MVLSNEPYKRHESFLKQHSCNKPIGLMIITILLTICQWDFDRYKSALNKFLWSQAANILLATSAFIERRFESRQGSQKNRMGNQIQR